MALACLAATLAAGAGSGAAAATRLLFADNAHVSYVEMPPRTGLGAFVPDHLGGLVAPRALAFGPDGSLYVADGSPTSSLVLRYSAWGGTFLDVFVNNNSGGLNYPTSLTFGPDGNLYVASGNSNEVLRYDGATGQFTDRFVTAGSGGLSLPTSLLFGPDGNLYVASGKSNQVIRYNGRTGALIDNFVTAASGGLDGPASLAFGPDGNLYVASVNNHEVLRYDGRTGAFVDAFVPAGSGGLSLPTSLAFGPDGVLYVGSSFTGKLLGYNGMTGAFLSVFVSAASQAHPTALVFTPPSAPFLTASTSRTPTELRLTWTYTENDQTGFKLWRRGAGADWALVAALTGNTFSFTDTGLLSGVSYEYRIQALNQYGLSPYSGSSYAATASVIPPPPYLSAATSGPGTIALRWIPNGDGIAITGYSVWRKGGDADWAPVVVLPANITSYIDRGLKADTKYTYRVRSFNGTAASLDWSQEVSATTPLVPPIAPTRLVANVVSATRIDLKWSLQTSDETAVEVWRKTGTGAFVSVAFLPPGSTSYSDSSVTSGTTYTYQVRAANDIFVSAWSNGVSATIP